MNILKLLEMALRTFNKNDILILKFNGKMAVFILFTLCIILLITQN